MHSAQRGSLASGELSDENGQSSRIEFVNPIIPVPQADSSFAVLRLQRWYRTGSDVNQFLPWLSAHLGHVDLTGTQRYLSATPETLALASRRFRRSVGFNPEKP